MSVSEVENGQEMPLSRDCTMSSEARHMELTGMVLQEEGGLSLLGIIDCKGTMTGASKEHDSRHTCLLCDQKALQS